MTHFIGIGGIGMSGLARILLAKGEIVSGSDLSESDTVFSLKQAGARIGVGHCATHIEGASRIVYSTAVKKGNPELVAAQEKGMPVLHRSQLLAELVNESKGLCVTGAHGKSSTSALLYWALKKEGMDPGFSIGAHLLGEGNGGVGKGAYFVAEADESDGSFLAYSPFCAIITNIDLDHLNYWKTPEALYEGYLAFAARVKEGGLIYCSDDPLLSAWNLPGMTYGIHSGDIRAESVVQEGEVLSFDIVDGAVRHEGIKLPAIGAHFALNALAVYALCKTLGVSAVEAFGSFPGLKRRHEKKGEKGGVLVYDDYAHHPAEIEATLSGFKKAFPQRRLAVCFQPHRYTRLRDLFADFTACFDKADLVCITPVYSAGEASIEGITGEALAKEIPGAYYLPSREELLSLLKSGDVVVTMGAGDITTFGVEILRQL